jgi:hypothetical protein
MQKRFNANSNFLGNATIGGVRLDRGRKQDELLDYINIL